MSYKPKGKCPHCEKMIVANVLEENYVRRDYCICQECNSAIVICRVPGCTDYAKSTLIFDHELCPSCTDLGAEAGSLVGKAALTVAVAAIPKMVEIMVKEGAKKA